MTISPNKWELDVQAYLNACNITATTPRAQIRDFAAGVNALGLWNSMVCWPLRSTQNAGTGTTAYSLGGLGTHNMTLVGGPTWGSDGLTMTTAHHAHTADFLDASTITVFVRRSGATSGVNSRLLSQWDFAGNKRSWSIAVDPNDASKMTIFRDSVGNNNVASLEWFSTSVFSSADTVISAQWVDGGGRAAWYGTTEQTLVPFSGYANLTARLDTDAPIILNAVGVVGAVTANASGVYAAAAIVRGSITASQREGITNLIATL
jgi:hypothetical protein